MTADRDIEYNNPKMALEWLETAFNKEKEKYQKCPVQSDMAPGFEIAQGWGYVISGYSLLEQSFKILLYIRKKKINKTHSLLKLFAQLCQEDREILQEYYTDYKKIANENIRKFSITKLENFLLNLDGDGNKGSFNWRYFPIEKPKSDTLPTVSVELLHEIVFGTIRIIEHTLYGYFDPLSRTRSFRLLQARRENYTRWLTSRMNSDRWNDFGDRLEILRGPDYLGRYDLLEFKGAKVREFFSPIPENDCLKVVDKREEIRACFPHLEEQSQI